MTVAVATTPGALLAAGLVASRFDSLADATDTDLADALRDSLTVATLWERVGATRPDGLAVDDGRGLALWSDPGPLSVADEVRLAALWDELVPAPHQPAPSDYLRLSVHSPEDACVLQELGVVGGRRVVAVVRSHGNSFEWRWPLRIGLLRGPRADQWLHQIRSAAYYGEQYEAHRIDPAADQRFEIVIVDADAIPERADPLAVTLHHAGCTILVGARPAKELLGLLEPFEPNISIALPVGDMSWWMPLFRELSHDIPIDAAALAADPDMLVAGDERILDFTAVGHWAMQAALQANVPELASAANALQFWHEHQGSYELNGIARGARLGGADPTVRADLRPQAAMGEPPPDDAMGEPPPADDAGEPPPEEHSTRHLISEFWHGEKECRKTLPPDSEITLELKIAVPEKGEIAADRVFPDVGAAGPSATLDVTVQSSVWPEVKHHQISLPMRRRDKPSTSASFDFTTGADGNVVEFDIVVSFENRPLQAATLTAAVRAKALPRERVRLLTHPLSGPAEPTPLISPADVWLDARGAELRNAVTDVPLPLGNVTEMLDEIETLASQTLGVEDAPDELDERAVALLVDLARKGVDLRTQLNGLSLAEAKSIELLVLPSTRILPLELAYEGTAPKEGAKLCKKHRAHPPAPGHACTSTSTKVVCPYAFWGMHRRITRKVQHDKAAESDRSQQLQLNDVVYAAAQQADKFSQPGSLPTQLLASAAQHHLGTAQTKPVTNWRAWGAEIKKRQPALLLVLGHTQLERGETAILIGKTSTLARPDVKTGDVHAPKAPAPIVVLMACSSGQVGDAFGSLPGTFTAKGAGAVIATLTKLTGRHGALAGDEVMRCLVEAAQTDGSVSDSVLAARRALIAKGVLLGLLLVSHGDVDMRVSA